MKAMSERTIKSKIESVYDVVQGEKMSDAKCMHLMNYIVPVARYFDHLCSGVPKKEAGELVAQGCFFHANTIRQLSNDFIATEVSRRKTVITKDAAGTTTKRITTTKVTKRILTGGTSHHVNQPKRNRGKQFPIILLEKEWKLENYSLTKNS